jgi:hypothetical protein
MLSTGFNGSEHDGIVGSFQFHKSKKFLELSASQKPHRHGLSYLPLIRRTAMCFHLDAISLTA